MKLVLDYTQRLNLHALMGQQHGGVDDIRLFWKLQDRINLSDEERRAINFRMQDVNGMQQVSWDLGKPVPAQEYEFNADEFGRIARMFKEWQPGFTTALDRAWLEPLLAQLDGVVSNGNQKLQ